MKYTVTYILLLLLVSSCVSNQNITGKYYSNFAVSGYFVTLVNITSDSTFEYRRTGDLTFDTAFARFIKQGKYLLPSYKPILPDTSDWPELRKQGITIMERELTMYGKSVPFKILVRGKKLFLVNEKGKIESKKRNSNYRKRKFYLKKTS